MSYSEPLFPLLNPGVHPDLQCIHSSTLGDLLGNLIDSNCTLTYHSKAGKYNCKFSSFYIVDCRFRYESDGGHIRDALHFENHLDLDLFFLDNHQVLLLLGQLLSHAHSAAAKRFSPR